MNKKLLLLIFILITLFIYCASNIEKYPDGTYIIKNYNKYEGKQVFLRAEVLGVQDDNEKYTVKGKTAEMTYRILVKDSLFDRIPQKGDLIDIRAISHLDQSYVVALEVHVRTSLEHKLLFTRSLAAIPIVLLILWRDRHQLSGGR